MFCGVTITDRRLFRIMFCRRWLTFCWRFPEPHCADVMLRLLPGLLPGPPGPPPGPPPFHPLPRNIEVSTVAPSPYLNSRTPPRWSRAWMRSVLSAPSKDRRPSSDC